MITVIGWCAGGKGGGMEMGGGAECSLNGGDGGRLLSKLSPAAS